MGLFGTVGGAAGSAYGGPAGGVGGSAAGNWVDDHISFGGHDPANDDLFAPVPPGGMGAMPMGGYFTPGEAEGNNRNNAYTFGGDSGVRANPNYDPNQPDGPNNQRLLYGPNSAQIATDRYQQMGNQWANMQAPTTNYGAGDQYAQMGNQARQGQMDAMGMYRDAASGFAPSAAEMQMRAGNNNAMASQLAMAAGARGQSGIAQAGYNAMGNNAAMNAQNNQQMGIQRAQEMATARGGLAGVATGMRGQDMQGQGMMDARSQYGSDLNMRNRAMQMQGQMGYEKMGYDVNAAQMGGQMAKYGSNDAAHALQVQTDQHSNDSNGFGAWFDRGSNLYGKMNGK